MRIESVLKSNEYLDAMKEQMESHFDFGRERYTGFFLGKAFSVTYHSGHEWNRRITNEKNTAFGFVRRSENGCTVSFIRCKGLLSPPLFLTTFGIMFLALLLGAILQSMPQEIPIQAIGYCAAFCFAVTLLSGLGSAFAESMTEAGQEGRKVLNALLLDPTDVFSYTTNQNHLDF